MCKTDVDPNVFFLFVYPFIVAAVAFAVDVAIWPPKLIHGFACVGG